MSLNVRFSLGFALAASGATVYYLYTRPVPISKPKSISYPAITTSNHTIEENGRTIGFAQYGSQSPNARILLFFHGLSGSRIIPVPGLKKLCERRNIRLVAIDRPGIGLTTPVLGKESTFNVSASDTIAVLEVSEENTKGEDGKVGVIGYSMGGPHALTFVQKYPDLVNRLYLIAPSSFYDHPKGHALSPEWASFWQTQSDTSSTHMCTSNRVTHRLVRWMPSIIACRWKLSSRTIVYEDNYVKSMLNATSDDDRGGLSKQDLALLRFTTQETFRQGTSGMVKAVLETFGKTSPSGWGWDVSKVRNIIQHNDDDDDDDGGTDEDEEGVETHIYAAKTDFFTPMNSVVELADLIGASPDNFKMYEDVGHLALLRDAFEDILS